MTGPELTDDQWARVSPLLPPQRPPVGRPPEDHRTILAGMLWIVRTGATWRELPATIWLWMFYAVTISSFLGWLSWAWINQVRGIAKSAMPLPS